ncbi:MAG TPA: lysophospholipid acyltransferase family protein [Bacilli bacterium]|nr:lysophospholipid acyltransferase family protein [Bacilli bacterium]
MFYRLGHALFSGYFKVLHRWQVIGKENIPQDGAVLLVSNHISNLDPPLVGCGADRPVHFMAKAELFKVPIFGRVIKDMNAFPVKRGVGDRNALRHVIQLLEDGNVVGIFPEGTRNKTGTDAMGEAHSGAANFALKTGATVVPTAIVGTMEAFKPIKLVFGEPVDLSEFAGVKVNRESIGQVTERITAAVNQLIEAHKH